MISKIYNFMGKIVGYQDSDTGVSGNSLNDLMANLKRDRLNLPTHEFLSNRYVLGRIDYNENDC